MKRFMKAFGICVFVLVVSIQLFAGTTEKPLKYVFYFIGDGLGGSQRQITEYYQQKKLNDKDYKLLMNSFPIAGIITSHSTDSLVTDSAAARNSFSYRT